MKPRLFLSAGEVSGDIHGSNLARELLALRPDLDLVGWGSHRMQAAGVSLLADLTPYSAVGLTEHLPGLKPISQATKEAQRYFETHRPDAVVCIDYQGANMVLAQTAKSLGIPTAYYIAPQEWIWGLRGGTRKVAQALDKILCIFEKEAQAYREAGGNVQFIGHPLLDMVPGPEVKAAVAAKAGLDADRPVIALFPGSRPMEVDRLLEPMLQACVEVRRKLPQVQVVMPVATPDLASRLQAKLGKVPQPVTVIADAPGMAVMQLADVVLAASGTTILEAAVVGTPVIATYRISPLAGFVARRLLKIPYVTLPNIVAGEAIVPELLQQDASPERMASEVLAMLDDPSRREQQLAGLSRVRAQLGEPGAVARGAEAILELAKLPTESVVLS
ncbi:Lipid-A-disaccharide synthase [compost metagenome]